MDGRWLAANGLAIFDGGIPGSDASIILTEGEQKAITGKKSMLGILGVRGKVFNPQIAVLLPVEGVKSSSQGVRAWVRRSLQNTRFLYWAFGRDK